MDAVVGIALEIAGILLHGLVLRHRDDPLQRLLGGLLNATKRKYEKDFKNQAFYVFNHRFGNDFLFDLIGQLGFKA